MIRLGRDCDYYNDRQDDESAPDYCEECYRWETCSKAIISKLDFIPIKNLPEYIGKRVWVQTPGIYKYGREATIEDVNVEKKIMWLVNDFTCHNYGVTWVAYPINEADEVISYERSK